MRTHSRMISQAPPTTAKLPRVAGAALALLGGLALAAPPAAAAFPSAHWTQVNQDGFVAGQGTTSAGSTLFAFGGRLYAHNEYGLFRMDDPVTRTWSQVTPPAQPAGPGATPARVLATATTLYAWDGGALWWASAGSNLAADVWTPVTSTGPPGGASPRPMVVFGGRVYGVYDASGSFEVWRTAGLPGAAATWEKVVDNSFGDPTNNEGVDVMIEYGGQILAGTTTLHGIFGDPSSYGDGVEMWESSSGDLSTWSQVNADGFGTMFPTPPCYSGTLCTFPIHQVIGSAAVYQPPGAPQAYLYVGTNSHFGGEIWRYDGTGLSGWTNVTPPWAGPCQIGCGPVRNEAMAAFQGALWVGEGFPTGNLSFYQGSAWTIEVSGPNPFDPDNGGIASLALHAGGLFAGTLHAFGGSAGDQVWRYLDSPADVTASKTASAPGGAPPGAGDTVVFTIVLHNAAGYDQLDNPGNELVDIIPPELTLVGASATSGTVGTAGSTVTWNGVVPAGGSVTVTITTTVNPAAEIRLAVNQATIMVDTDGDGTNDTARLSDDPGLPGAADPTAVPLDLPPIPAATPAGLVLLAAALLLLGAWFLVRSPT